MVLRCGGTKEGGWVCGEGLVRRQGRAVFMGNKLVAGQAMNHSMPTRLQVSKNSHSIGY